jgi:hypothetical protein
MVRKLGSCLRSKNELVKCLFRFTGNPAGRLHAETKEYFVDPYPKGSKVIRNQHGMTRMYIFSTVKDNPYLFSDGTGRYIAWLKSLPSILYKAWYEGCWDIAIGSMFYDVWDTEKIIIEPIRTEDIPDDIPRFRAHDWGQAHPSATLWYFISTGEELNDGRIFPKGAIIIFREYYTAKKEDGVWKGTGQDANILSKEIKGIELEAGDHHLTKAGPADNQINNIGMTGKGVGEIYSQNDVPFTKSIKDAGSNVIGWNLMRVRMKGYRKKPMIYFTENCVHCIRTIPSIIRHEIKIEDIAQYQEDHLTDTVKYIVLDQDITLDHKKENMRKARRRKNQEPPKRPEA